MDNRVRLHETKKVKSSVTLPPDEDSVTQAIYRVHYQVYPWIRSNQINIEQLDFSQYGWRWCLERELVVPVWFIGDQFPPEFSVKKQKLKKAREMQMTKWKRPSRGKHENVNQPLQDEIQKVKQHS